MDKFTTLALEATLRAYLNNELEKIPTLKMLNLTSEEILQKAKDLHALIQSIPNLECQIIALDSLAGGGSLPQTPFKSHGLSIHFPTLKASNLEKALRERGIITRINQERVCLDLRCIDQSEYTQIYNALQQISEVSNAK